MKYLIATEYGKDWVAKAEVFDDAQSAARAWHKRLKNMPIRTIKNGQICIPTIEEMRPIYDALSLNFGPNAVKNI